MSVPRWIRTGWFLLALALAAPVAQALVINLRFATPGESARLLGGRFGAPGPTVGGGDVAAVFNAAADAWEALLFDSRVFDITVGWLGALPSGVVAAAAPGGDRFNEIALSSRLLHFVDPTPTVNEEFGAFVETAADLGGGPINTSRGLLGTLPSASIDLFSTALHEIGHVLGNPFDAFGTGQVTVTDGPFAGTVLPCARTDCAHLSSALPGALMNPSGGFPALERALISGADLLYVATDGRFGSYDLATIAAVPAPSTLTLVLLPLLALGVRTARRWPAAGRGGTPSAEAHAATSS
jgi:hypothetical protein